MMRISNKGFTLLEVLTATAILALVCIFVLKISAQILETWENTSKELSTKTEASLALDLIEEDLETAFPYFWTYNQLQNGEARKNTQLSLYAQGRDGKYHALAYQIAYNKTKKQYDLYRCKKIGLKTIKDFSYQLPKPPEFSPKEITLSSNLLARNVQDLSVKFLYKDRNGNSLWTEMAPFLGSAICAEVSIKNSDGDVLTKRISLIVNSRL